MNLLSLIRFNRFVYAISFIINLYLVLLISNQTPRQIAASKALRVQRGGKLAGNYQRLLHCLWENIFAHSHRKAPNGVLSKIYACMLLYKLRVYTHL
jgi:hypothetical protein